MRSPALELGPLSDLLLMPTQTSISRTGLANHQIYLPRIRAYSTRYACACVKGVLNRPIFRVNERARGEDPCDSPPKMVPRRGRKMVEVLAQLTKAAGHTPNTFTIHTIRQGVGNFVDSKLHSVLCFTSGT